MPVFQCGFKDHPSNDAFRGTPEVSRPIVSMFAGCGGLDLGFQGGFSVFQERYPRLRFHIAAAYDSLSDAVVAYRLNLGNEIREADLSELPAKDIPRAEILTGGFPCQDFSSSGPKTGLNGKRGQLYLALKDYMRVHQPSVVIGENVPHLEKLSGGAYIRHMLDDFESEGYKFAVWNLYGPDFGLPQSRRRLFLVGVRHDIDGFPQKPSGSASLFRPIEDGIGDLKRVTTESVCNQTQYYVATRASSGGGQGDHTNVAGTVSYCIRANPRGRIQFHYELPRRLTVRECARLQSFPDTFVFPFSTQRNILLIGNAVPPLLGHAVAQSIQGFLDGNLVTEDPISYGKTQSVLFT